MSEISARKLYILVEQMNAAFKRSGGNKALSDGNLASDFAELIVKVTTLTRDTHDEIIRARFPNEERNSDLIKRLYGTQQKIINRLTERASRATSGPVIDEAAVERLLGITEQLENAGISSRTSTRKGMIHETEALIADVKGWDLEDYAKQTLLIQINQIARVIHAADIYSETDLRLRVKAIIADFASEFAQMDKKHQTQLERLVLWARRGFFAGTVFLGLTADVATITAALPSPPRLIGKG